MKSPRAGFTLIELLVVIGLIAVLAGVFGLALGRGNSGTALQGAQSISSALVSGARAQAATSLSDAAVLVNVTTDSEGFLNEFYIATWDGSNWVARGEPTRLPGGVFMVPASGAFPPANVIYEGTPAWTASTCSAAFGGATSVIKASDGSTNVGPDSYRLVARFTPRGTTGSNTLTRVVFSPAERTDADTLRFNNAAAVRGMTISNYGIATLINDAEAF